MKDYTKMSDFEINKAVAELFGHKFDEKSPWCFNPNNSSRIEWLNMDGTRPVYSFDYCNDLNDWANLLVDNRIDLHSLESINKWEAVKFYEWEAISHEDEKPGRAVAICFLMMKEAENAKQES